jgi:hypothetical protein
MDGSSASVSCIEKATVPLCSIGWAELWHGVGSIDLKLWEVLLAGVYLQDFSNTYSCPRKSLQKATVFFGLRTSWVLA